MADDPSKKTGGWGPFKPYPEGEPSATGFMLPKVSKTEKKEWKSPGGRSKSKDGVGFGPLYKGPKGSGAILTSKTSAREKSFASFGHYEYAVSALAAAYDLKAKKADLQLVKVEGKVSLTHIELDFVDIVKSVFAGPGPKPAAPAPGVGGGGGPFAARVGDLTSHGSPLFPGTGSPTVLIEGKPAWRATSDYHLCPVVKGLVPDVGGVVLKGASTVLINGMPASRVGDLIVETPGGPNAIVLGSATVTIGEAPPPPVKIEATAKGDYLTAEGELVAQAGVDLKKRRLEAVIKAGAMATVFSGELAGALKLRIPFTSRYLVIGAKVGGSAASIGAEASAGLAVNATDPKTGRKKLFKASAEGKAAVALGLSTGFSLEIE